MVMLLFYAALNCFIDGRWTLGSMLCSLGVSVKMNVLLFAPALLLVYPCILGLWGTVKQLTAPEFSRFWSAVPDCGPRGVSPGSARSGPGVPVPVDGQLAVSD